MSGRGCTARAATRRDRGGFRGRWRAPTRDATSVPGRPRRPSAGRCERIGGATRAPSSDCDRPSTLGVCGSGSIAAPRSRSPAVPMSCSRAAASPCSWMAVSGTAVRRTTRPRRRIARTGRRRSTATDAATRRRPLPLRRPAGASCGSGSTRTRPALRNRSRRSSDGQAEIVRYPGGRRVAVPRRALGGLRSAPRRSGSGSALGAAREVP